MEADLPQRQGLPFLYDLDIIGDSLIPLNHGHSFRVRDYLATRIFPADYRLQGAVVGFHVVYHEIIHRPVPNLGFDIGEELFLKLGRRCIDKGYLLVNHKIGVIADTIRERPLALEQGCLIVVHSDVPDSFTKSHASVIFKVSRI